MAALLMRALIMFTGGLGGPWSSGLVIAAPRVTKGLLLAAADALAIGLGVRLAYRRVKRKWD